MIPNSVTRIGSDAFLECSNLTNVTNLASTPQTIYSYTFNKYGTLHVLPGCGNAYRSAEYWKYFTIVEDAEMPSEANLRGYVNGDGSVNIADISTLVNIVLGKDASANRAAIMKAIIKE